MSQDPNGLGHPSQTQKDLELRHRKVEPGYVYVNWKVMRSGIQSWQWQVKAPQGWTLGEQGSPEEALMPGCWEGAGWRLTPEESRTGRPSALWGMEGVASLLNPPVLVLTWPNSLSFLAFRTSMRLLWFLKKFLLSLANWSESVFIVIASIRTESVLWNKQQGRAAVRGSEWAAIISSPSCAASKSGSPEGPIPIGLLLFHSWLWRLGNWYDSSLLRTSQKKKNEK